MGQRSRLSAEGVSMGLIEILTIRIGSSVAKSVLRLWLKDVSIASDAAIGVADILEKQVPSFMERRRAQRQFEGMAEEIATRLAPLVNAEFTSLPQNEIEAAIIAVGDALSSSRISVELLTASDLDPTKLERHIRETNPQIPNRAGLSADATHLFDRLLTEACNYSVEIAATLPTFGSEAARQSLQRETEILELVRLVLNRLPKADLGVSAEDRDGLFETQYRREIARRLDRLELFGVDVSPASSRYALSIAYITLTTTRPRTAVPAVSGATATSTNRARYHSTDKPEGDADYLRVNDALAGSPRMFIRGQAGSGKRLFAVEGVVGTGAAVPG
jgi:hypothetical protein